MEHPLSERGHAGVLHLEHAPVGRILPSQPIVPVMTGPLAMSSRLSQSQAKVSRSPLEEKPWPSRPPRRGRLMRLRISSRAVPMVPAATITRFASTVTGSWSGSSRNGREPVATGQVLAVGDGVAVVVRSNRGHLA